MLIDHHLARLAEDGRAREATPPRIDAALRSTRNATGAAALTLGLRWADYDAEAAEITVTGRVVRVAAKGLVREKQTKSRGRLTCSPGRTRTSNPSVNSRTLCQLSYRGPPGPRERWRRSRDDSSVLASPHPTRGTKDRHDPSEGDPTYGDRARTHPCA
jgi:hypothetical protein